MTCGTNTASSATRGWSPISSSSRGRRPAFRPGRDEALAVVGVSSGPLWWRQRQGRRHGHDRSGIAEIRPGPGRYAQGGPDPLARRGPLYRRREAAGPGPVSYTHLRAHETGRNLVCRLLLEKKKQKTKTKIITTSDNTINEPIDNQNTIQIKCD